MSEYIDRQSLINHLNQSAAEYYSRAVERVIELEPAADVAPVRRGKWLNFYNDYRTVECSVCAELYEVTFDEESNSALFDCFKRFYKYCPNCGADMREVPNDD